MNRLTLYIIYIAITNISCGSLTRNVALTSVKHELQRKQVQQTGDILDLRYVSRNFKPGKFHSSDTLFYDPVFENHSVLADFLNKKEVKVNSEMELKLRQKIKCTGLCETSLCPWDVEINKDEERTPKNIAKARCRSKFCDFDFTGMSKWSKFKMKMDTCCESVYTGKYKSYKYNILYFKIKTTVQEAKLPSTFFFRYFCNHKWDRGVAGVANSLHLRSKEKPSLRNIFEKCTCNRNDQPEDAISR